jgi:nickel transport protein
MRSTRLITIAILLILSISLMPAASAHRCYVEQVGADEIVVKAFYEGDSPMGLAEYQILNADTEEVLYEGETDEDGFLSFTPVEDVTQYTVVVDQFGHMGEATISATGGSAETAELPLFMRIFTGFGYLLGLAGIAMIYTAKKKQ